MKVHFSSKTSEWATPISFFAPIQKEFLLNADVCATKENAKLEAYWTKEEDGLAQDWTGIRAWMNPPYGREIGKWVKKASDGGGRHSSCPASGPDRHPMVSRLHLQQGRDPIH